MRKKTDETLNLPDLVFVQFCEQEYGINRGVYNVIEKWFYDHGQQCILSRRKHVIDFLEHVLHSSYRREESPRTNYKFGPGGVSTNLQAYWRTQGGIAQ